MLRWTLALALLLVGCDSPTPLSASGLGEAADELLQAAPEPPPGPLWKRLAKTWVYPSPIPNFELTDHDGRAFRLGELRSAHVMVGLIFTHCSVPSACPLTTQKMHEVGKLWRAKQQAGETGDAELRLLTLTFDPEADTPEVLASYSELVRRDVPDWLFATGPEELMETHLPKMFGVIAKRSADGDIAHDVKVALLGPGLRPRVTYTNNAFEPEDVIAQVLR